MFRNPLTRLRKTCLQPPATAKLDIVVQIESVQIIDMAKNSGSFSRKLGRAEIARYIDTIRPWEDADQIRAGIKPDRRPWYARGDARKGVTAYEALYHFVRRVRAEELYRLDLMGYADEKNRDPDWPDDEKSMFDRQHFHWKLIERDLAEELVQKLRKGELLARGYNSAGSLDSPRQLIAPERWNDLVLDLTKSRATGPGFEVTQILITKKPSRYSKTNEESRAAPKVLKEFYKNRLEKLLAAGRYSSREEDIAAAKKKFGKTMVTVEMVRDLRRELAPSSWTGPGRRGGSRNRKGR